MAAYDRVCLSETKLYVSQTPVQVSVTAIQSVDWSSSSPFPEASQAGDDICKLTVAMCGLGVFRKT